MQPMADKHSLRASAPAATIDDASDDSDIESTHSCVMENTSTPDTTTDVKKSSSFIELMDKIDLKCAAKEKRKRKSQHGIIKKAYRYNDLGAVYNGQLNEDGKRHGIGTLKWNDGSVYNGEWKEGKPNGQGTMKYSNGDTYTGQFLNDKRHGMGTYTWSNGERYIGHWEHDKRHGIGTREYVKGDIYSGEWKDGKRNGQGTMKYYIDGSTFVGGWKHNKKHGKGVRKYSYADGGKLFEGEWKYGIRIGRGKCRCQE